MKIIYTHLIDSVTGKPLEITVPDNFQFSNRSLRIKFYAIYRARNLQDLKWIPLNSSKLPS